MRGAALHENDLVFFGIESFIVHSTTRAAVRDVYYFNTAMKMQWSRLIFVVEETRFIGLVVNGFVKDMCFHKIINI